MIKFRSIIKENEYMELYYVLDKQGCNFMNDTEDEPLELEDLRKRFWDLNDSRTKNYKDFTIDFIQDNWEVEICKYLDFEEDFLPVALEKYKYDDIIDFEEHFQNLETIDVNLKNLKDFVK